MGLFGNLGNTPAASTYLDSEAPAEKPVVDEVDEETDNSKKKWKVEISTTYNAGETASGRKYTATASIYSNPASKYDSWVHQVGIYGPSPETAIANVEEKVKIWVKDRALLDAVPKKKTMFF